MNPMQVVFSVDLPELGSRIKKAREDLGLSPTHVAAAAGMSSANLHLIEGEKAKSIPHQTLKKLSEVLGVDFESEARKALVGETGK